MVAEVPGLAMQPEKADKGAFCAAQADTVQRLLRSPLTAAQVEDLCQFDDQAYFFIDTTGLNRHYLDQNASTIIREFQRVPRLNRPAEDNIRMLNKVGVAVDLFSVVRLDEFVRAEELEGTPAAEILTFLGVRSGLPDNCLVPSLRYVERDDFRKTFMDYKINQKHLIRAFDTTGMTKNAGKVLDQFLSPQSKPKRFTITETLAFRISDAITQVTGDNELDANSLFELRTDVRRRNRIGPLPVGNGNVL